jgi:hypothetical protein
MHKATSIFNRVDWDIKMLHNWGRFYNYEAFYPGICEPRAKNYEFIP